MLSQDVAFDVGDAREALLLTPKARVIATMTVLRRAADDYLLSTEAGLGDRVLRELGRARFAAKVEIEPELHDAVLVFGPSSPGGLAYPVADYVIGAWEVLDGQAPTSADVLDDNDLELLRIQARTPRAGLELDDRVLPAEAGLVDRAVSFTKGCYPGQEPVARLHYRGHANRGLRVLRLETWTMPPYDTELTLGGKVVGRITSSIQTNGEVVALAYVRREVPDDATLAAGDTIATQLH